MSSSTIAFDAENPSESGNTALVGYKRPPVWTQWQPGQSGNPGGMPKGTPKVSVAYQKLLALSAAELATFEPATVAESIALARIKAAQTIKGLPDTAEITDRTEGKAPQTIQVTSNVESERIIIRVQERFLARTGIELSRSDAIERLREIDPQLAAQLSD